MKNLDLALYIGQKIKDYRLQKKLTQQGLADKLQIGKTTISNYEKGFRTPRQKTLFQLADVLDVSVDDFFPPIKKEAETTPAPQTDGLTATLDRLTDQNRQKVQSYAIDLLDQQETDIDEPATLYDVQTVSALAAGYGFSYDDFDIKTKQVTDEPPRHDIASLVDGDSMLPDYVDGDVVYLVDKGFSSYSGQVCAVVVDDETYIKRVYTEPNGLRLVSINPDYPDKFVDFPPSGDTHIKIFSVVGSATPIEK